MWNLSKKFLSLLFAAMFSLGVCSAASVVIVSDSTAVDYRKSQSLFSRGCRVASHVGMGRVRKRCRIERCGIFQPGDGGIQQQNVCGERVECLQAIFPSRSMAVDKFR